MNQAVDAIFENGVFRPLDEPSVPLSEGQQVRLIIEATPAGEDLLELAAQVYADLSPEQMAEVERIALERRNFFGDGKTR